jgi:hypothetical protein
MSDAPERLAVIGTDPAACARLVIDLNALIAGKADENDVLDAWPLAAALLEGHSPDWPRDLFFILIVPADARFDPATTTLRTAMLGDGIDHAVVSGALPLQVQDAMSTWQARQTAARLDREGPRSPGPKWRHVCGRCGDGGCEAATLAALRSSGAR